MTHLVLISSNKAELREGPESGVFIHQPQIVHREPTDNANRHDHMSMGHNRESGTPVFESKDSLRVKQHHT